MPEKTFAEKNFCQKKFFAEKNFLPKKICRKFSPQTKFLPGKKKFAEKKHDQDKVREGQGKVINARSKEVQGKFLVTSRQVKANVKVRSTQLKLT